jgi:hypothetical protein
MRATPAPLGSMTTSNTAQTRLGAVEFRGGAPMRDTTACFCDLLDFIRGVGCRRLSDRWASIRAELADDEREDSRRW